MRRYRSALSVAGVRPLLAATFVTGLGTGALTLVLVLLVEERTGSYSHAGLVSASYVIATAAFGPLRGRLVDRLGPSRVLVWLAAVHGISLLALLALVLSGAGALALVAPAAVAGLAAPTAVLSLRLLWEDLLGAERDIGYAIQAILLETFLLAGPLLAALVAALADPVLALGVVVVANVGGSLGFAATRAARQWRPRPDVQRSRWGALASAGVRTLALVALPLGAAVGVIEVAAVAFADERGDAAAGGLAIAALAAGSLLAGVVYGGRAWPGSAGSRYVVLVGALAVTMVPLPLAGSLATFIVLMAVGGVGWAPITATSYAVLDEVAKSDTVAESASWMTAMLLAGMAAGYAAGGALVDAAGASSALWASPALGAIALVLAVSRSGTLGADVAPGSPRPRHG